MPLPRHLVSSPLIDLLAEAASIILALAAGEVDEEGLGRWINDNLPKG
jgi:hypothetical protein